MNDCYLNFLVSFRALFSLDVGANLVNSKQTIGIILPDLSLLGYAVPVESFGIGLFVILFAYLIIEYNVQLLSHEKFKIAMNMLHTAHTPLILLRNQLEELKTGNLPEPLSQQVEEALGYAECIIYCNRNIATLNKVNKRIPPKTSTVNLELSTYVTSIVNQCRAHANSRQIRLTVGECSDCVSCRINENIMTAALQHLINKMILISESGCCISINVTHTMNSWQLQISNNEIAGQRAGKMFPFIPIIFPVYGYSDLWTVRKIIRLHGGKITGCRHGKAATFQIVIPTDCHCQNQSCPVLKHSSAKTKTQIDDSCESPKSDKQNTKARETSHILLVMADKLFSDYLKKTLSRYFQISVLDNPELLINTAISQNPDAIIIDDNVNGISGDTLSTQIKENKMMGYIPIILLLRTFDSESYLSHLESRADRLEMIQQFKTEGITDLILDLRYNYGGAVELSRYLSASIAGSSHRSDVFMRMQRSSGADEYIRFGDGDDLGLNSIRIICSEETASSSELVISGLRGIDFPVKLFGSRTEGKNVGMEVQEYKYGNSYYEFAPITFRSFNAKDWGDYADGIEPDVMLNNQNADYTDDIDNAFPYAFGDWDNFDFNLPLWYALCDIQGVEPNTGKAKVRSGKMKMERPQMDGIQRLPSVSVKRSIGTFGSVIYNKPEVENLY